jgi:hypothetical protein
MKAAVSSKHDGKYKQENMASHKLFYPEDWGRKCLRNSDDNPPDCTRTLYINYSKVPVADEGHRTVMTTNIHANRAEWFKRQRF